jgi:hypothetical protein
MAIKPIETRYKGYRFRSRIEARWAVFFDTLGVDWIYEPEGFALPSGPYLPDFFIRFNPDFNLSGVDRDGIYVEIKPYMPEQEGINLARDLSVSSGHGVVILAGDPVKFEMCRVNPSGRVHFTNGEEFVGDSPSPDGCGFLLSSMCCLLGGNMKAVEEARKAARSARFEHGECG